MVIISQNINIGGKHLALYGNHFDFRTTLGHLWDETMTEHGCWSGLSKTQGLVSAYLVKYAATREEMLSNVVAFRSPDFVGSVGLTILARR